MLRKLYSARRERGEGNLIAGGKQRLSGDGDRCRCVQRAGYAAEGTDIERAGCVLFADERVLGSGAGEKFGQSLIVDDGMDEEVQEEHQCQSVLPARESNHKFSV